MWHQDRAEHGLHHLHDTRERLAAAEIEIAGREIDVIVNAAFDLTAAEISLLDASIAGLR